MMTNLPLEVPPSPPRWSRIPFDIFEDVQGREKRPRFGEPKSMTCISDIPETILALIFSCISDTRSRNAVSLVCIEWYSLERATRTSLCLRGSVSDLYLIPRSFQAVESLDLSHCSPWGYSLFQSIPERAVLVGQVLSQAFPKVKYMTIYVRDGRDIDMVACFWSNLQSLKLVRWHQRPTHFEEASGYGMEFRFLMQSCKSLRSLDLSEFYCWTEDIPPALMVEPFVSRSLHSLNLLNVSLEGFKAVELGAIASACPNLEDLRIVLVFDSRFVDFVDDEALLHLGVSCKKLKVLHLIDTAAFVDAQTDREDAFGNEDAQISRAGLEGVFEALPLLEDLAIVLSQNVRDAKSALEVLASKCKKLKSLCLGRFHGLCNGPQPNGLQKLALHSCKEITRSGLRSLVRQLRNSLVDVQVTCCLQLDAVDTLWALQPIQNTISKLLLDYQLNPDHLAREQEDAHRCQSFCNLSTCENAQRVHNESVQSFSSSINSQKYSINGSNRESSRNLLDLNFAPPCTEQCEGFKNSDIMNMHGCSTDGIAFSSVGAESDGIHGSRDHASSSACRDASDRLSNHDFNSEMHGLSEFGNPAFSLAFREGEWSMLKSLALWIPIGELLSSLPVMGLQFCPSLREVQIKVEGDCRACPKPKVRKAGLSTLALYKAISKLTLDCSETVGYALSAPQGHMELSLWERWYLQGIESVKLQELDYWPPQDRDANRRGLSLPSSGLISQCATLRKLIIHGTINEHLLRMFTKMPNLRDVQLRLDYYPAPEVELNTETRADACRRFEAALAERGFPD
ncbi:hypothetical protein KP509_14G058400 [Ceratopteris richardii]|uniref:COI1 F-box domain-containing protein n=1 Tax=Ceratopteris richardii TaxID=49495 RepID=A0A8T2T9V4_CERRI|nr:hypothetical protein KP509_14G058400 [Ceratopteris richardii]KAH7415731.1 hypothetical protein KP509_14G058400 [Ceratopteris richardii]